MSESRERDELRRLIRSHGFDAVMSHHPEGWFVFDLDGRLVDANAEVERSTGRPLEQLIGQAWRDFIWDENPDLAVRAFEHAARGVAQEYQASGTRPDGREWILLVTLMPVVIDGRPRAVIGTTHDLGAVEAARRKQDELEERLGTTLDSISDAVYVLDHDWRFTYLNSRAEALTGSMPGQLLGCELWHAFPEIGDSPLGEAYRSAVRDRVTRTARAHFAAADLWVEATAYPTSDGLAVYVRDVGEEEKSRAQLAESQRRVAAQAALLDVATDAIIVHSLDHRVLYWNLSATRLYGWQRGEVIGQPLPALIYRDAAAFSRAVTHTLEHGHWEGELEQVTRAAETIVVESTWTLVRDDDGNPESLFSVSTDITERKRQEDLLLRTQRMESLGTLASGIAHDLNNVLTPILMSAQLLATEEDDPGRREILAAIETGVKRGADMVRQVLSFARGVDGRRTRVNADDLIGEVLTFSRDTLPANIVVTSSIERGLWPITGDPTQLLQVLMNLVTNARDAMETGGHLSVSARNVVIAPNHASVMPLTAPGDYVLIQVEDDGVGMTREVVDKIFEPFFTTKEHGRGTGLGLATSMAIVSSHGGFMDVVSEPGAGSRFELYLPSAEGQSSTSDSPTPVEEPTLPRGTGQLVLVVDDEAPIRQAIRQTLETHGYRTLAASHGAEALDVLEAADEVVEVVVTDMMMPVMDGPALARALATLHPGLPIIATSGLNAQGPGESPQNAGVDRFLPKPYTSHDLLRSVHDALSKGAP